MVVLWRAADVVILGLRGRSVVPRHEQTAGNPSSCPESV